MQQRLSMTLRRAVAHLITTRNVSINRPAPLPLPKEDQREFEELLRKAQVPLSPSLNPNVDPAVHPDARIPITPRFVGDINPETGEQGGPKQEPVGKWGSDSEGDWSFKGKVSDF